MRLNLIEKKISSQSDANRLGVSVPKSADNADEHCFDRLEMQTIARNELFASAFWLLESGEFKEADEAFAEFLRRTDDDPSALLRSTVMLARKILNTPATSFDGPSETDKKPWTVLDSVIRSACFYRTHF